jgi:integrase
LHRRSRGDGSVFYDATRACWVGVLELERDPDTRKRRRRKVSAPTKTAAREKLAELRREYKASGVVPSATLTVQSAVNDWMSALPQDASAITRQVLSGHAARINAALGRVRLARLSARQVDAALRTMADDGLSASTLRATRSVLVRSIRRAQRDGLVLVNVAELADPPGGHRRKHRAMTKAQVQQLLASITDPWWRAYVLVGVMTGLRPGELLGLRWEDLDFAAGVIRVRHSQKESPGGSLVLADLKTATSRRTMVMPAAVRDALSSLGIEQAADRERLGRHYQSQGLVFCDSAGRPRRPQYVTRHLGKLAAAAGLGDDPRWVPYELRHTFVSLLSHHGVLIESIADAAGHSTSQVTRTVYRHQLADVVTQAAATMDEIFPVQQVSGS